jgi:hypothetical protein
MPDKRPVFEIAGTEQRNVRQVVGQVNEKGFVPEFFNFPDGLLGIALRNGSLVGRPLHHFLISHQGHIVSLIVLVVGEGKLILEIGGAFHLVHVVGIGDAKISCQSHGLWEDIQADGPNAISRWPPCGTHCL